MEEKNYPTRDPEVMRAIMFGGLAVLHNDKTPKKEDEAETEVGFEKLGSDQRYPEITHYEDKG